MKELAAGTHAVTYDWDASGRLEKVSAERPLAVSGMRQAARETVNGTSRGVDYYYDALNRLTKETVGGSSLIYDSDAGYGDMGGFDKVGNRRSRTAALGLPAQSFTYNARDSISGGTIDKNGNTTESSGTSYKLNCTGQP